KALLDLRRLDAARAEFEAARDTRKKLAGRYPLVVAYQQELAAAHSNLGSVLVDLKLFDEARAEHEEALAIRKKLADALPNRALHQIELGGGYCNVGVLIRDRGDPAGSLEWFAKAVEVLAPVHAQDPRNAHARQFLRNTHWSRAWAYGRLRRHADAVKDW